jgi:hypothetical protein
VRIREAGIGFSAAGEGSGRDFRVVLIREGLAKSGRYYTRQAVERVAAAAPHAARAAAAGA